MFPRALFTANPYTRGTQIYASTPPAWSPTDFVGLRAWFKADALVLADGAAVTQWDDSSGNAYHVSQATGTKQPTYRSDDVAVDFDGGDSLDRTGISAVSVVRGLVAVVAKSDANTGERMWFQTRETLGFTAIMRYRGTAPAGQGTQINALGASITTGLSTTAYQLWVGYTDSGNVYLRQNGTQVATTAGTPTTRNFTQMHVGSEVGIANYFDGRIKEIVFVTRASAAEFSAEDIASLETYLINKHSIT